MTLLDDQPIHDHWWGGYGPQPTGVDRDALYREAVEHLRGNEDAEDRARAHLLCGELLRRHHQRSEARAHLRVAHETFSELGRVALAERARVELAATVERARPRGLGAPGALTTQEREVALLAADGAMNREIAQRLFVSPHTVEYHLRKVFRKLAITSRRELAGRLSAGPGMPA